MKKPILFVTSLIAATPLWAAPVPNPVSKAPIPISDQIAPLLPPVSLVPKLNGPALTGVSPGHPFLYLIPATGAGPLKYSATGLPPGLKLEGAIISGIIAKAGTYPVRTSVVGPKGKDSRILTIECGANKLALTPPMGWNSWNVFGEYATAAKIARQADWLIESGLAAQGYQYIVVDDTWQDRRDKSGLLKPNKRFLSPDFKTMESLVAYVHQRGLKFGLMTSPNQDTPTGHVGSAGFEEMDAAQYAKWGVDYVKADWAQTQEQNADRPEPGQTPEEFVAIQNAAAVKRAGEMKIAYTKLSDALNKTDRDIVLNATTYGFGWPDWSWVKTIGAQSWTSKTNMNDNWDSLRRNSNGLIEFTDWVRPGFWSDPGFLMLGRFLPRNPQFTRLSLDEQKYQMSLWSIAPAPLMLSCNLDQLNPNALFPITTALVTNSEAIAINQDPLVKAAKEIEVLREDGKRETEFDVWTRPLSDGTMAVAVLTPYRRTGVKIRWASLGLTGPQRVRDVWLHRDMETQADGFSLTMPGHSGALFVVGTPKN